jgi:hypothetical protein
MLEDHVADSVAQKDGPAAAAGPLTPSNANVLGKNTTRRQPRLAVGIQMSCCVLTASVITTATVKAAAAIFVPALAVNPTRIT